MCIFLKLFFRFSVCVYIFFLIIAISIRLNRNRTAKNGLRKKFIIDVRLYIIMEAEGVCAITRDQPERKLDEDEKWINGN